MAINYINSFLQKQNKIKIRKTRSDKKKSVRVYVDRFQYQKVLKNSKLNDQTITAYVSDLVSRELDENKDFEEVNYQVEDHIVHVKLTQDDYEHICNLSASWLYPSIRQTTHRVLINALKKVGV